MTMTPEALRGAGLQPVGIWRSGPWLPAFTQADLLQAVSFVREPVHVVREAPEGRVGVARGGAALREAERGGGPTFPLLGTLPALYPEWLGDRSFLEIHGLRFPYVAGAMANGIHTARLTIAVAKAGMLGFFGAAGLGLGRIEQAIDEIVAALGAAGPGGPSWGCNLIHAPNEPRLESDTVALYLRKGVRRAEAAAYMGLTPMVVRFAYSGARRLPDGRIDRQNHLFAKISRPEVAARFLSPAPSELLDACVRDGWLTRDEAELARGLPVAEDITVEADSGGHTDNRPLAALLPAILGVRDELAAKHGYRRPIRVGAAGGLGTPEAVAAAFALGAAYVLTGSVNQACVESGLSDDGKRMLAEADLPDVVMAPSADMFELGVKVQVLRRGTMFGVRAQRLHDLYAAHGSIESLPADARARLEREQLRMSCGEVWSLCERFFAERDPAELERAARDPKHRMALIFRWYLGMSSKWAIAGDPGRRADYQIWCGPAMGAFNRWVKGSFLEAPQNRTVVQVARNLLEGAAVVTRAQQLRTYGVPVPSAAFRFTPRPLG
ncbi:PfaD family polyunsaturated fatty acid/polyketide biosynthesis protein [Sorangium sp. So ce131]|uniref:PfaD family polyunsaturated fatty acid/polyketide biosynthesis protein n=1 Tax=Sorangium sp. So ce131 TaxID=3133282 RepID=UPI003F6485F2